MQRSPRREHRSSALRPLGIHRSQLLLREKTEKLRKLSITVSMYTARPALPCWETTVPVYLNNTSPSPPQAFTPGMVIQTALLLCWETAVPVSLDHHLPPRPPQAYARYGKINLKECPNVGGDSHWE